MKKVERFSLRKNSFGWGYFLFEFKKEEGKWGRNYQLGVWNTQEEAEEELKALRNGKEPTRSKYPQEFTGKSPVILIQKGKHGECYYLVHNPREKRIVLSQIFDDNNSMDWYYDIKNLEELPPKPEYNFETLPEEFHQEALNKISEWERTKKRYNEIGWQKSIWDKICENKNDENTMAMKASFVEHRSHEGYEYERIEEIIPSLVNE